MTPPLPGELTVLIKGAGDLATGVAWRLHRCGFPVVMTELSHPLTVRRAVAFAEAVYRGEHTVEGITARRCHPEEVDEVLADGHIPVVVDPEAALRHTLAPSVLVDGIMAKRNTGTRLEDAPLVVALGPGFTAGVDCHAVVETHRGHTLGRVLWRGSPLPDTGTPGPLPGMGVQATRVLRAPVAGRLIPQVQIGQMVEAGTVLAWIETPDGARVPLRAPFAGVVRGLIHESVPLIPGLKIGDLDPRARPEHAFTISDKSLAIGGGVLEAVLTWWYGEPPDHLAPHEHLEG